MNLFWLEYLHFIVAVFAILVSVSAATLFLITYRTEQQTTTIWRTVGFLSLAVAFFLYILERKFGGFGIIAIVVELFGLFGIYKGMVADLNLEVLRKVPAIGGRRKKKKKSKKAKAEEQQGTIRTLLLIVIFGIIFILGYWLFEDYLSSTIVAFSIVFILATIRLQINRFRSEGKNRKTRLQNLWPLLGYIFLLWRAIALVFYRLPESDAIILRQLTVDSSLAWQIGIWMGLLGFLGLAIWAWTYIKVRTFLRAYVTFLAIAILVSSLGSLVFTQLIFSIVEENNLELMSRGAQTEVILTTDRQDTALFVARTIATNTTIINQLISDDAVGALETAEEQQASRALDVLRILDAEGQILASHNDEAEVGETIKDDLLIFTVENRSHIKTFDVVEDVQGDMMIARAMHPVISGGEVIAVVEASYKLDNTFVDYTKSKTGLDATIYVDGLRSATTIKESDGVSRWSGTVEEERKVLTDVLEQGNNASLITKYLGEDYYAAYTPLRNSEDEVIGMISVGTPTVVLFEDTRQQLITTFLIVTLISLLAAGVGYVAIQSFRKYRQV